MAVESFFGDIAPIPLTEFTIGEGETLISPDRSFSVQIKGDAELVSIYKSIASIGMRTRQVALSELLGAFSGPAVPSRTEGPRASESILILLKSLSDLPPRPETGFVRVISYTAVLGEGSVELDQEVNPSSTAFYAISGRAYSFKKWAILGVTHVYRTEEWITLGEFSLTALEDPGGLWGMVKNYAGQDVQGGHVTGIGQQIFCYGDPADPGSYVTEFVYFNVEGDRDAPTWYALRADQALIPFP